MSVFFPEALETFAQNYPEVPHTLRHRLVDHPLLTFDALAGLAESLPAGSIEYNHADLPLGIDGKPAPTGIPIGETIRSIASCGSWAAIKNIEQAPAYAELLHALLAELRPLIEPKTGGMLHLQGFVFVTSPGGVTPYHFDPEHNILLQIAGTKTMTQFPAGDTRFAPQETHESYHTGGPRELSWNDALNSGGKAFPLAPGQALFVPVMAPHHVVTGPEPSISLSITWRSEWSYAEADAHAFNAMLRRMGMRPANTGRWPRTNAAKAYGWRLLRKLGAG